MDMGSSGSLVPLISERLGDEELLGAEIGVHRGATSAKLLRAFPKLHLRMVDPWIVYAADHPYRISGDGCARLTHAEQQANYNAALEATKFAARRRVVMGCTSREALRMVPCGTLDFVFIDGDHTYDAVKFDLNGWAKKLRPSGLMCGHDYGHPRDVRGRFGVKAAVDEFAAKHGFTVHVEDDTLWWLSGRRFKDLDLIDVLAP